MLRNFLTGNHENKKYMKESILIKNIPSSVASCFPNFMISC